MCLSCGTGDVDVVSNDQLEKTVGDINIQHGICGGRIFGSFYKSPYPSIRLSPRRRNWDAPIEFNEYSPRGHKRGSSSVGYKNGLKLNADLAEADSWSVEKIEARSDVLVGQVMAMFSMK